MKAMRWEAVKFGDVVSFKTGKLDSNAATPDGVYPFFTCAPQTLRTDTSAFDTECVLLAGNNANGVYPIKYFNGRFNAYQRTYVIRSLDDRRLATRFLFYALQPKLGFMRSISTGAATKFLTLSILKDLDLELPPLPTQRKIAAILSAYDDLIENNTRRIRILQQMAQALYREWFVHFRFPGHEKVQLVDSPLGKIPEGWEVKRLSDLFQFIGGSQPPKSEHIYEEKTGYVRFVQNRDYGSSQHLTYIRESRKNKLCYRLDILIDKYGEPGKTRFGIAGAYNVALAKLLPHKPHHREWLRGLVSEPEFSQFLASASMAATRASLNNSHFNNDVAVPSDEVFHAFQVMVEPLLKLILIYQDSIATLRRTRDLLLPRLISGEVDVSEVDIAV
ncbi:MAG: restriction endonuclease subunit S [Armatimonadetes bacterium]|nr:restriction endonuclease subunit S [Armatimonadota bacterium]